MYAYMYNNAIYPKSLMSFWCLSQSDYIIDMNYQHNVSTIVSLTEKLIA